jgi:hypothetical protein
MLPFPLVLPVTSYNKIQYSSLMGQKRLMKKEQMIWRMRYLLPERRGAQAATTTKKQSKMKLKNRIFVWSTSVLDIIYYVVSFRAFHACRFII